MNYQLRVDGSYSHVGTWLEQHVIVRAKHAIVYEHPATKTKDTHCHVLLLSCDRKEETFRNILKGSPDDVIGKDERGRKKFALATKAGKKPNCVEVSIEGISYFSKGKFEPVYVKEIDQTVIDELKMKGYDVVKNTTRWANNGTVEIEGDEEEKRKTVYEMQQEVAARIDQNQIYDDKMILLEIKDVMRKYKHKTHMYDMMNWFDSVRNMSRRHGDAFLDEVLDRINSRRRI